MADADSLPTAKRDGIYRVGKAQFRFKRGAKLPANAVLVDPPKKQAPAKGPKEQAPAPGPDETTEKAGT